MGISRRTFIKGLGSGLTALGLSDVILPRTGWAGAVKPAKITKAAVTTSICPYCGVGCGLVAYTKDGKLVDVEGDPDHPISQGALCSKAQSLYQIRTVNGKLNPKRVTTVRYRAPNSTQWEEKSWDWAFNEIANRIKKTRDESWLEKDKDGACGSPWSACPTG